MRKLLKKLSWLERQILKLILKSFAMRMMTKQILMVWGGLLFVHLQFWCYLDFIVAFIIWFITIFSFISNTHSIIQLYLCVYVFLSTRRRNGIRLCWNWYERRASVSFIGMWPGLFNLIYDPMFIIDYHVAHILIRKRYIDEGTLLFELKGFYMAMKN